jgi:ketosteroid isomerase-like protein
MSATSIPGVTRLGRAEVRTYPARDTARAMSQESVETVKRALEAWKADDLDAFLAELHPEVEWHPSIEPALEGGVRQGGRLARHLPRRKNCDRA